MNLRLFPGLNNLRGMTRESARHDVMAGLSVAAVALPVGLAYAAMMGVPPVAGLWAAIAGMLGYADAVSCGARPVNPEGPVEVDDGPNRGAKVAYLRIHDGVTLEVLQPPDPEAAPR